MELEGGKEGRGGSESQSCSEEKGGEEKWQSWK